MNNKDVKPLPIEEWDSSLSHIIEDMNGKPINVHALMAHNPELLNAWWNFRNYSVNGGTLGKRLGELVILRMGIHMKAWYEWGSHVERAMACGISIEDIERIKNLEKFDDWNEEEGYLLRAVDALVKTHAIPEDILSNLDKYFSTAQIMDIIAIHGMYNILGCMINSWGLELDPHIKEKLPEGVTRENFEKEFPRS